MYDFYSDMEDIIKLFFEFLIGIWGLIFFSILFLILIILLFYFVIATIKNPNFKEESINILNKNKFLSYAVFLLPFIIFLIQFYINLFIDELDFKINVFISIVGAMTALITLYINFSLIFKQQQYTNSQLDSINDKLGSLILWRQDRTEPVNVRVKNMYDFIIHAPVFIAKACGYFKKELLEPEINNSGSDLKAIEEIINGEGIAITDPIYLSKIEKEKREDLILLAPIIIKPAIWVLKKENPNNDNPNVFIYSLESSSHKLGLKYLDNKISDPNNINFTTIEDIDNIDNYLDLIRCIYSDDQSKFNVSDYDYLFLTQPEFNYLKEKFVLIPDHIKNGNYIFTALITTKEFIRNNPLQLLKFLKALKLGFLKSKTRSFDKKLMIDILNASDSNNNLSDVINKIEEYLPLSREIKNILPDDLYLFYKNENIKNRKWLKSTFEYFDNSNDGWDLYNSILDINNADEKLKANFNFIIERLKYNG